MEDFPKINSVRAIIDLFEDNCRNETASRLNRNMSKSFAGLSFTERKYKSSTSNDNDVLYHLDQRLTSISLKLKEYKIYAKEFHIAVQDELIEIMKLLINIDASNNTSMFKKRELMYDIQARFNELSTRLPDSSDRIRQGFGDSSYKPYSWKRPNSVAGAGLNARQSAEKENPAVYSKGSKPQRTQSVVERYVKNFQQPSKNEKLYVSTREFPGRYTFGSDLKGASSDSQQESTELLIGGAGGIRRTMNNGDWKSKRSANVKSIESEPLQNGGSEISSSSLEQSEDIVIGGAAGIRHPVNSSFYGTERNSTSEKEGVIYESVTSPSSMKTSPDFLIGGQAGIRRSMNSSDYDKAKSTSESNVDDINESTDFIIGGVSGIRRSNNSRNYEPETSGGISPNSSAESSDFIIGGQGGVQRPVHLNQSTGSFTPAEPDDNIQLEESSSEVLRDDATKSSVTLGGSENAKLWTYNELRGRRRPVSLGGTVVTLNSPEDIISSINFSREYSQSSDKVSGSPVVEDVRNWNDDNGDGTTLQSVNLLKRFFELKTDERKKLEKQKSFNAQEDQREDFQKYVQSIEKSFQDGDDQSTSITEDNTDGSSNNTIVELEVEVDEYGRSKQGILARESSIQVDEVEVLNSPVLRNEVSEVDEVVITTSVHEDVEDLGSISSEHSIYLDPVD